MKKTLSILVVIGLFILQNCKQDEISNTKTKLLFDLNDATESSSSQTSFSDVTSAIVSITTPSGEEVITRQHIGITMVDNLLKCDAIEISPGNFVVSEFFLIDGASKIIYASPRINSNLAKNVQHVVGKNIEVQSNRLNTHPVDVLSVANLTAANFGYKVFNISAVQFIQVGVKASDNSAPFVKAEAMIIHGDDTLAVKKLGAEANLVKFDAEDADVCKLILFKDGYARNVTTFTPVAAGHELLTITLEPAFTFRVKTLEDPEYSIAFEGFQSSSGLNVDWGDGQVSTVSFRYTNQEDVEYKYEALPYHFYQEVGRDYFVTITGNLDNIYDIEANSTGTIVSNYSFNRLNNMTDLNFFLGSPRGLVDLRSNNELRRIILGGDSVLLPSNHAIKFFGVFGRNQFAPSINSFIDNIYKNTVRNNLTGGNFNFSKNGEGEDLGQYIGEPTPESWAKLHALHDQYQWEIVPAFE